MSWLKHFSNYVNQSRDIDDLDYNSRALSSKAGFPIRPIYSETIVIEFDGQQVPLLCTLSRQAKQGKTHGAVAVGYKQIPIYLVSVKLADINDAETSSVADFYLNVNRDESQPKQRWGNIDENALIPHMRDSVQKAFLPTTKGGTRLRNALNINKRDPAFKTFLENQSNWNKNLDSSFYLNVNINEEPYTGDYPVIFDYLSSYNTWHLRPGLEHSQVPGHRPIFADVKMPNTIHTIEQFKEWAQSLWSRPELQKLLQDGYIKFLKSFPFLESQQQENKTQLSEILPLINGRVMDVQLFRNKLLAYGYIRPSKRKRNAGPGMQLQQDIDILIDTKKVLDAIYSRKTASPNYFYAVLAYLMHRHKAGNIGFMPITIVDSVRDLSGALKRAGLAVSAKELEDYLDELARHLLKELLDVRPGGTAWDNWSSFYGGAARESDVDVTTNSELENFINFAVRHGIDAEYARTKPKSTYRQLALKLHPDTTKENKTLAQQQFILLQSLWDNMPGEIKMANNWLFRTTLNAQQHYP